MIHRWSGAALVVGLALLIGACTKSPGPASPGTPAGADAPPTVTTAPAPVAPAARNKPETAKTEASTVTRVNEDGSETVEDTTGDSGTHNPLLAAVAAAATTSVTAAAATATAATTSPPAGPWVEGVNYTRLVPAQPTSVAPGQVEVLEFFWYACPHCYALDPLIESWRKTKPAYISFLRVPVVWAPGHRALARLFYALESMGKLDELHSAIFKEIHVNNDPLVDLGNDAAQSERIETAFVVKHDVSESAFKTAYHSFSVESALQRAEELGLRYKISGVPTFVVNGKYVADVGTAGGEEKLIDLVNYLAGLEHKH
jgi:thiol:disulfide interchange protein DsbA